MFRSGSRGEAALWLAVAILGSNIVGVARGEEVEKPKIPRLEFRILANEVDEPKALEAAKKVFVSANKDDKVKKELERLAKEGKPPMPVAIGTDKAPGYTWVEIGQAGLLSLHLDEDSATKKYFDENWKSAATARAKGEAVTLKSYGEGSLLFSRICLDTSLSKDARDRKKFDYFLLTRTPQKGKGLTSKHLIDAKIGKDEFTPHGCIEIVFGKEGGDLMFELTKANRPSDEDSPLFERRLAIIVNGKILSAPGLVGPIKSKAIISGALSREELKALVEGLRQDIAAKKK